MARFAIDLHGGDFGPSVIIPASFQYFRENPQHYGVLVGDSRVYRPYVQHCPANIEWIDADPIGDAAEKPSRLLRKDGFSSIEICFRALHNQDVDVLVSSEHTGVLLVLMSKYGQLHSLLSRPVLASWLPTPKRSTVMLDLGASFTATADQLLAFAAVGIGILRDMNERPKVGLLNIGQEYFKGPPEVRAAHETLAQSSTIDYQGFVEASEAFKGNLDILVTDGFTGNSVIKASEGALNLIFDIMRDNLSKGLLSRLLGLWLKRQMRASLQSLDPRLSNGALVAGSNLLVVKSHGNAGEKAFSAALKRAGMAASASMVGSIWSELDRLLDSELHLLR